MGLTSGCDSITPFQASECWGQGKDGVLAHGSGWGPLTTEPWFLELLLYYAAVWRRLLVLK